MGRDMNRDEGDKGFHSLNVFTDIPKGDIRLAECGSRKKFPDRSSRD